MTIYNVLDIFFIVFHLAVIIFNLFGWIYKPLRKWNLGLLLLTGLSWSVLGIFYGFGYCPLTQWHWEVLSKLGRYPVENSYTQYLFDRITGMYVNSRLADTVTLAVFLAALFISSYLNIRDFLRNRRNQVPDRRQNTDSSENY